MAADEPYFLQKGSIYAVPIIHYNMEMALQVKLAFEDIWLKKLEEMILVLVDQEKNIKIVA